MNPVIVIPSYWARNERGTRTTEPGVYDHATPLNAAVPELARCLDSLEPVRGITRVIVLLVASNDDEPEARLRVEEICSQHQRLNPFVVSAAESLVIQAALSEISPDLDGDTVSLRGYGAIKNMGLLVAAVLGHDAVVFLDDDEIITSPEFLVDAVYGLGHMTRQDLPVIAKTGYFLNQDDSPYATAVSPAWYDRWWNKRPLFNMWMNRALNTTRISRSNILTGGCFALHAEAFTRVGFDPYITRGEDLDYLLDLRMYGFDVWFDNQWCVVHRPPNTPSRAGRFEQDVYRWIYQQEKLRTSNNIIGLHQVTAESLMPYPGPWLSDELDGRIAKTAFFRALFYEEHEAYLHILTRGRRDAYAYAAAHAQSYLKFQTYWPQVMVELWNDEELARRLYRAPQIVREEQALRYGYQSGVEGAFVAEGDEPVDWLPQIEEPAGGSSIPAFFSRTAPEGLADVDPEREAREEQMASFLAEVRSSTGRTGADFHRPTQEQLAEELNELAPSGMSEDDTTPAEADERVGEAPEGDEPAEAAEQSSAEAQIDEGVSQNDAESGAQIGTTEEAVSSEVDHSEEQGPLTVDGSDEPTDDVEDASAVSADAEELATSEDEEALDPASMPETSEVQEVQESADQGEPEQDSTDHAEEGCQEAQESGESEAAVAELPAEEGADAETPLEESAEDLAEPQAETSEEEREDDHSEEPAELAEEPSAERRPRKEYVVPEFLQVPLLEINVEIPDFLKHLDDTLGPDKTAVLERQTQPAGEHDPDLAPDSVGYELVVEEPQSAIPAHEPLNLAEELEEASRADVHTPSPAVPAFLQNDDIMPTMPLSREEIEAALQRALAKTGKDEAQEIVDLVVDDDLQEQLEQAEEAYESSEGETGEPTPAAVDDAVEAEGGSEAAESPVGAVPGELEPAAADDIAADDAGGDEPTSDTVIDNAATCEDADEPSLDVTDDRPEEEVARPAEEAAELEVLGVGEQGEDEGATVEGQETPEDADDPQDSVDDAQDLRDAQDADSSQISPDGDAFEDGAPATEACEAVDEPDADAPATAAGQAEPAPADDAPEDERPEATTDEPTDERADADTAQESADDAAADPTEPASADGEPTEPAPRPKTPYQLRRERMSAVLDEMGDRHHRPARRPKVLPKPKTKTYLVKREPEITSVSVLESFAQTQDEVQMVQQPPQPPEFFVNDLAHDEPDTNRGDVQLLGPLDLASGDALSQTDSAVGGHAGDNDQELGEEKSSSRSFPIIQPPLSLPDHPEDDV